MQLGEISGVVVVEPIEDEWEKLPIPPVDPNPSSTNVEASWPSSWPLWWWPPPMVATSASSVVPLVAMASSVVSLLLLASSGVPLVVLASAGLSVAVVLGKVVSVWRSRMVGTDSLLSCLVVAVVPRVGIPECTLSPPMVEMAVEVAVVLSVDAELVSPLLFPWIKKKTH